MGNYCCQIQQQNGCQKRKSRINTLAFMSSQNNKRILQKNITTLKYYSKFCKEFPSSQSKNKIISTSQIFQEFRLHPFEKGGESQIFQICPVTPNGHQILKHNLRSKKTLIAKKIPKKLNCNRKRNLDIGSILLLQNNCSFLIKGLHHSQDSQFIFHLMQKQQGGDLSTFNQSTTGKGDAFKALGEQGIKIVLAGIILGLQFIHHHNVILCDLKLENVVIGNDGYPLLIDFDFAKLGPSFLSNNYKGTIAYVAPQVFQQQFVDRAVDLWALGILIYTLLYEETPFDQSDIQSPDFKALCLKKQNKFSLKRKKASKQIVDLINSLLKVNAEQRIGYQSIEQIKRHSFFKQFPWQSYAKKQLQNPIKPIIQKYCMKHLKQIPEPFNFGIFSNQMDQFFINDENDYTKDQHFESQAQRKTKCDNCLQSSSQLSKSQ